MGVLAVVLYHLLFGRLFPICPVIVGFSPHEYSRAIVYHHGQLQPLQLSYLDDVVAMEEKYHGMPFCRKPEIILCGNDGEYRRLTGATARFITINGRVFVSRRAQIESKQGIIDLPIYLTHELSHCLLQQHASPLRVMKMPRWVLEGTAMDCAGQVGTGIYPTKAAVYEHMARGMFCDPADFGTCLDAERGTAMSCPVENRTAFFYSEFGCFIAFIRTHHGDHQFQMFLKALVESTEFNMDESFEKAFGSSLNDDFERFKAEARRR